MNTYSAETAHSIKNNIGVFLRDELFPRLETLFDDYQVNDEIIRFDKIQLNIAINSWDDPVWLKTQIYNQLKVQFETRTKKETLNTTAIIQGYGLGQNEALKVSPESNTSQVFLFFLGNGFLPWYGAEDQINEFIEAGNWVKALENHDFKAKLDGLFKSSELAAERFLIQFSDNTIFEYLIKNNPGFKSEIAGISEISKKLPFKFRLLFFKLLLSVAQKEYDNWFGKLSVIESLAAKKSEEVFEGLQNAKVQRIREIIFKLIPDNVHYQSLSVQDKESIKKDTAGNLVIEKTAENSSEEGPKISGINKSGKVQTKEEEIKKGPLDNNGDETGYFARKETVPVLNKTGQPDAVQINENATKTGVRRFITKKDTDQPFIDEVREDTKEIWVQNAGLIVVHPFIGQFFINTGIADKSGKFIPDDLDLAVQSLHYLATGDENFFEGRLVMEKFLCGVPLKMPVSIESQLTEKIKSEATDLLNEVVKNWPALKKTSADGLRQMFIWRDGKLVQNENNYKIIVERKAQDILLEKLNWNISMVKLPWIRKIIFVEW